MLFVTKTSGDLLFYLLLYILYIKSHWSHTNFMRFYKVAALFLAFFYNTEKIRIKN